MYIYIYMYIYQILVIYYLLAFIFPTIIESDICFNQMIYVIKVFTNIFGILLLFISSYILQ